MTLVLSAWWSSDLNTKHSSWQDSFLDIRDSFLWISKHTGQMSLSYMEKRYHRGYFFLLRQKCFPRAAFTPEGRLYARAKRGLVIETQGGKGCPRIHFCLRRKKYPRWDRFAMEDVTFFQFGGNSLRRVNVWKVKQLQRPKKANKRPQRPKKAKKVKSTFSYTGKKNEKSLEKNFPREEKSFFLP